MKTLRLNLKKDWYNMIDSGEKTEEYREIKPYWLSRLMTVDGTKLGTKEYWDKCDFDKLKKCISKNQYIGEFIKYDIVTFVYGYTNKTMTFDIDSISFGKGNKKWGAPDDYSIIIKLGKRIY